MAKRMRLTAERPCWQDGILAGLGVAIESDEKWAKVFAEPHDPPLRKAIHLAVFTEPYLQYILDGLKTIESRFSVNRCAPYRRVAAGDFVALKRAGGPVVALCEVGSVWFYELEPGGWKTIRDKFSEALCATDPAFWTRRKDASFATLLTVKRLLRIDPIPCYKRDRRGWVVLGPSSNEALFKI